MPGSTAEGVSARPAGERTGVDPLVTTCFGPRTAADRLRRHRHPALPSLRTPLPHPRLPCRRAPRPARSRSRAPGPARRAAPPTPSRCRTVPRSDRGRTDTPSGRLAQLPVEGLHRHLHPDPGQPRLFRSSATGRAHRSSSPRKAARARCFRSWRRSCVLGSVLWLPGELGPEDLHQRRRPGSFETPKSHSTSRRVRRVRSSSSS